MNELPGSIGIIGAMPDEVAALNHWLHARAERRTVAGREFLIAHHAEHEADGVGAGHRIVLAQSRVGKVAAAVTATRMIETFEVDAVIFTGLAGALDESLRVGDIVVASSLCQHDMDASPLFPPLEIPLLGTSFFEPDAALTDRVHAAAERFIAAGLAPELTPAQRDAMGIGSPRVIRGVVTSGDLFCASNALRDLVRSRVPTAACVEMEGAAVAQVCAEHGKPFAVVRAISDAADDGAADHFMQSLPAFAAAYSLGIVRRIFDAD
ncbi:MAG: 5'-methylthioadenosine/adenosylhomocysteine nucleosidase [Phycisphaerales bacterium JB037]